VCAEQTNDTTNDACASPPISLQSWACRWASWSPRSARCGTAAHLLPACARALWAAPPCCAGYHGGDAVPPDVSAPRPPPPPPAPPPPPPAYLSSPAQHTPGGVERPLGRVCLSVVSASSAWSSSLCACWLARWLAGSLAAALLHAGHRDDAALGGVAAVAPFLTGIYLGSACSCHEILRAQRPRAGGGGRALRAEGDHPDEGETDRRPRPARSADQHAPIRRFISAIGCFVSG
jgi:hypothetical protein